MNSIDDIFDYLGTILAIINAVLYFRSSSLNNLSKTKNILAIYLLVTGIIQVTQFVLAKYKVDNLFLSHFYFLSQFVILSIFYKQLLNDIQSKIISYVMFIIIIVLGVYFLFNLDLLTKFNAFEAFITTLPVIIYAALHMYNSLSKTYEFKYFNTGALIYLTTSALIFIAGDYLNNIEKSELFFRPWFINKVLYVGYLLLILIEWKVTILPIKNK